MMSKKWLGEDYDLLRKNCCHFSNEFAKRLGVGPIPNWVLNLAGAGATCQDGYNKFEHIKNKGKKARGGIAMDTYRFGDVTRGILAVGGVDAYAEDACKACTRGISKICLS